MRRIYLDQKDWIALARAATGKPDRPSHADVLTLLRAAVAAGDVSLPLSQAHYQETSHRKPYASRLELATTMAELSRLHTIAPFYRLSKDEMRYLIAAHPEQFDGHVVAAQPAPVPFGRGGDHAFGHPTIADGMEALKAKYRPFATGVEEAVEGWREIFEFGLLAGHPEHDTGPAPADQLRKAQAEDARRRELRRQERLKQSGTKGEISHRVKYGTAYDEKQDDILEALSELGMKKMPGNASAITWFVENVPTMYCDYELSRLKEEATNQPWTDNDVRDVGALCAATVYADVIVTEVSWSALLKRELAERYETQVFDNVEKLIPILLAPVSSI